MSQPPRPSPPRFATIPRTGVRAARSSNSAPRFRHTSRRATPAITPTISMGPLRPRASDRRSIGRSRCSDGSAGSPGSRRPTRARCSPIWFAAGSNRAATPKQQPRSIPIPETVSTGVARQDVVRLQAQYTHLLFDNVEANVNAAVAYGFDSTFGSQVSVLNFGSIAPLSAAQFRLDRVRRPAGLSLLKQSGRGRVRDRHAWAATVGRTLHVGLGARYAF